MNGARLAIFASLLVAGVIGVGSWYALRPGPAPEPAVPLAAGLPARAAPVAGAAQGAQPGAPLIDPRDVPEGQPTRPAPDMPIALPHGLTPQMLEWAQELGDEMDRAQGSPETAARLFDRIEPCADGRDRSRATQVERAICLIHANRLAELQPAALGQRYRVLEQRSPDEVRRIAREFMSN